MVLQGQSRDRPARLHDPSDLICLGCGIAVAAVAAGIHIVAHVAFQKYLTMGS